MEKEYQAELFEDFKDKESRLKYIAKKIIPGQKHTVVHLSFEAVILCVILIILGLIVSFAVGVEAGKKRAALPVKTVTKKKQIKSSVVKSPVKTAAVQVSAGKTEAVSSGYKLFTIQVISTKDKSVALAMAKELKVLGYSSTVLYNEGTYQVCAGAYATREEAQKYAAKLHGVYKGCFVKNR